MRGVALWTLIGATAVLTGCGSAGGTASATPDAGANPDLAPASRITSASLPGAGGVVAAVGGNLEPSGPLRVVVALDGSGLRSFTASAAGTFLPAATALPGATVTGLALARLDDTGKRRVVAFTSDRTLFALDGESLKTLWSVALPGMSSAGPVVPGDQDGDGDDDVAVFSGDISQLISVETAAADWTIRDHVRLPTDILGVAAGDLGGNKADEYLFMGVGGLVEAVTIGGFNYVDDRPLSGSPHARAAFADFDGDGKGDVAIASLDQVELWTGDGGTRIALASSVAPGSAELRDLVAVPGAGPRPGVATVDADGRVGLLLVQSDGTMSAGADQFTTSDRALRLVLGNLDPGAASPAIVVVGTDGACRVWRDPR